MGKSLFNSAKLFKACLIFSSLCLVHVESSRRFGDLSAQPVATASGLLEPGCSGPGLDRNGVFGTIYRNPFATASTSWTSSDIARTGQVIVALDLLISGRTIPWGFDDHSSGPSFAEVIGAVAFPNFREAGFYQANSSHSVFGFDDIFLFSEGFCSNSDMSAFG
ncbi:hypothetical protein DXZ20_00465 [Leptolyngbyaceae cyanobacterium CCMR0081]|uniref:Uncharacterized protein n=1 Tax=Adonisia turfae CCMR0081 TaxID=2292702 RepID=A0A6M0RF20_9CYAN|nr:hypothetical protein [Adonisia turfae CCMR0081]